MSNIGKSNFTQEMRADLELKAKDCPEGLSASALTEIDRLKAVEQFYIKKLWDDRMPAYEEQGKKMMAMEDRAWSAEGEVVKLKSEVIRLSVRHNQLIKILDGCRNRLDERDIDYHREKTRAEKAESELPVGTQSYLDQNRR